MLYRNKIVGILIALLLFSNLSGLKEVSALNKEVSRATWIWNTNEIVDNRVNTLEFLQLNLVTDVYLQINENISVDVYKSFIQEASSRNIKVHALDGAPNWVSDNGVSYQDRFFAWLKAFQNQALKAEQFSGVHLDVEPYLYAGWNSQFRKTVLAYQSFIERSELISNELGLPFAVDIPFWFDEINYKNSKGKGKLSEWVIDHTDSIAIMAYRDEAYGPNGIIELVRSEMNYASKVNKPVIVSVETGQSSEDMYVSFYEEGQSYMFSELDKVAQEYGKYSSFNGFAIHYLHSWMNMKP